MTVLDFISLVDENFKCLWVIDEDGFPLSQYDGKNSIDEKYNNCIIKKISQSYYGLDLTI